MKNRNIPKDIIGSIVIVKFPLKTSSLRKKLYARKIIKENKGIKTVLEKYSGFAGRLRKQKTKHILGEKTRETYHVENGCKFFVNVDEAYFSPRLSNERKLMADEISKKIKNNGKILVMFAGVAPFPVVIAKRLKSQKKKFSIVSSEINRKASEFANKNVAINNLQDFIEVKQGDSKKLKTKDKFDIIIMPRPNLKDTFLKEALKFAKKGTMIYYHGFGEREEVLKEIEKDTKNKISKIKIRTAGEIAPYKFRWLANFSVK